MNTAPLRTSLLTTADRDAAALVAAATEQGRELVARARAGADAHVAAVAAAARERAALRSAEVLARARTEARALVVGAEGDAIAAALSAAAAAADHLRDTPRYEQFLDGLAARATVELGPGVVVERDARNGGLVGRRDRSLVDLTIPALLALAVEEHGDELTQLCR